MFYLTTNINKTEPSCISHLDYVHVKARADGNQTLIITEHNIVSPDLIQKTAEEAQEILNKWIDQEDENPELDMDGNPILQNYIDLGIYG